MFEIVRYSSDHKPNWDQFVENSKNGTFLLKRDFMEYHSDRFHDYSLLIYLEGKIVAILPANLNNNIVYSHQGLTYGGLILADSSKANMVLTIFSALIEYFKNENIQKFIYKPTPYIYHTYPSEEDLYALFRSKANLFRRDVSTTIDLSNPMKFSDLRKRSINKALKNNLTVEESDRLEDFYHILENNLTSKYDCKPVHTIEELKLLLARFPENIKLYVSSKENKILAGVILFINKHVVHAQYISSSSEGKELGALDLIFNYLIKEKYKDKKYFDFGISTEQQGLFLNEGLIQQKEMFGGRAICYDHYEINIG